MGAINVLVIEDNALESELLVETLTNHDYAIVGIATNYKDALTLFYSKSPDIVIIDVFLDGNPEGITFAETITSPPNTPKPFVFLTSSKDRHIFDRAKLTHPYAYLLKPFNELEVLYAIEMAMEKFYNQPTALTAQDQSVISNEEYLFIKKNRSLVKVFIADISHIEVEDRYCNVYTDSGRFVVLTSLVKMIDLLDKFGFLRTHRNYLVNKQLITEINLSENYVVVGKERKIPLSESYKHITKEITIL